MKQGNYVDVARGKVFQVVRKQELQEVLKFPIDIFWNLEARNLK